MEKISTYNAVANQMPVDYGGVKKSKKKRKPITTVICWNKFY